MDILRDIKSRLVLLDHQGIINLASIQRWVVLVVVAFSSILYLWDKVIMEDDPTAHFPPGLVPLDLRRKLPPNGFTSEDDARAFAIRDIDFAVIACLERNADPEKNAMDTIIMMKSAALLSKAVIHFHIFTDDSLYPIFMRELDKWPSYILHRVSFHFSHVTYPELFRGWRDIHISCSSLKLFLPNVLKGATHVLYINSDALFLGPVENLWKSLLEYDEGQVASLLPGLAPKAAHKISKRFPVQSNGLNSDIVLYDIYRLRHSTFEIPVALREDCPDCPTLRDRFVVRNMTWNPNMLHTVYNLFSSVISAPHQDIFDIIYYFNPGKFHLLPNSWGFRWDYCDATLRKVRTKFLNAVLDRGYDTTGEPICESTHLIHGDKKVSHPEFDVLKELWRNATYKNAGVDMAEGLDKVLLEMETSTPDGFGSRSECEGINTRFFLKSLKEHQGCGHDKS